MHFSTTDTVDHNPNDVYLLIRDKMPDIVPFLPDIDSITVQNSTTNPDGSLEFLNIWEASIAKIPAQIRGFLSKDLLKWKDKAVWPANATHADWEIEPFVGKDLFKCKGVTLVSAVTDPNKCTITIEGDLAVYPEKLPGVPAFLASQFRQPIESFIVALIVPNFQTLAQGIQNYYKNTP